MNVKKRYIKLADTYEPETEKEDLRKRIYIAVE